MIYDHSRSYFENLMIGNHDHDQRSFCRSPLWLYWVKNLYFYVPIFRKPPKIHDFATNFFISQKNIFDMGKNYVFTSKNSKYLFVISKDLWSPIILRSLTKYMIYNHSRSWSAKTGKIWSTITHDRDLIGNDRRSRSDTPNSEQAEPNSLVYIKCRLCKRWIYRSQFLAIVFPKTGQNCIK